MNARSYTTAVHGDPENKKPFNLDRIVRLLFTVGLIAAVGWYV